MTSYSAIFDDLNTFENWQWLYTTGSLNSYSNIGVDIWLYNNSAFDTYKTWLLTGEASARVSSDNNADPQLASSVLQTFRTKIEDYDGLAIHMFVAHEVFTIAQQESAGCIHKQEYGMTCAVVSTNTGGNNAQQGRSYWFPDTSSTEL